ncbi:MAG: OmpA family protein [Fulvivirga sp.]
MQRNLLILTLIIFGSHANVQGQNISSLFAKAEQKGDNFFYQFSYEEAIVAYKKAMESDPGNDKLKLKIAESYRKLNDVNEAADWYGKVLTESSDVDAEYKLHYAEALSGVMKYEEAKKWYRLYNSSAENDTRPDKKIVAIEQQEKLTRASSKVRIATEDFNSAASDFSPAFYRNEIVFVSARNPNPSKSSVNESGYLDLYRVDGAGRVQKFYDDLNSEYHEGPAIFYEDGTKLIFTRNNYTGRKLKRDAKGVAKLKLYSTSWVDNEWSKPASLPFNSDEYSVGHPAMTSDGQALYFASDMPGGLGGTDIYKVSFEGGQWGTPVNLGAPINTEGNEMFPFIAEDRFIYFASNGHGGLGGLDLFGADLQKGKDAKVTNLGVPLNSQLDDFGLIVDNTGLKGYFSSNRNGGRSRDDIYSFISSGSLLSSFSVEGVVFDKLDSALLATSIVYLIRGNQKIDSTITGEMGRYRMEIEEEGPFTLDVKREEYKGRKLEFNTNQSETGELIANIYLSKDYGFDLFGVISEKGADATVAGVNVTIIDNFSGEEVIKVKTDKDGSFAYDLLGKNLNDRVSYQIKLDKEGYLGKLLTFNSTLDQPGRVSLHEALDLNLDKIEIGTDIGKVLQVNPIYFDLGKFTIRPDAATELLKIVQIMKENPTLEIELGSHTDARGSSSGNLRLSDKRAKSSVNYIISQGIEPSRITGKGYGEALLINQCGDGVKCSEEEHQLNRRTEFKITKF